MGIVYAAYDPKLDRKIAIKVMRRRGGSDPERSQGRMLREAQTLAKLSHPNVVAVHDTGLLDGQVFVAMDYVEGDNLRQWLRAKKRTREEIIDMVVQSGAGLAAAHAAGIVHRDFKPDNVLVGVDGRAQVLDFGLARVRTETPVDQAVIVRMEDVDDAFDASDDPDGATRGTDLPGRPAGTPAYMAPEQHLRKTVGDKADQFAFCVTLYEALCGRPPFPAEGKELREAIIAGEILEPPRHSPLPRELRQILWRGMAKEPDDRFASMDALLAQLQRDRGRRRRVVGLAAGGAGLVAVTAAVVATTRPPDDPCAGSESRLDDAWGDDARQAIASAFGGSGRIDAERSATAVTAQLDDYAARWVAMYEDACRATHVRHEQSETMLDLRMECLERREQSLDALVQTIGRGEGSVLDRAPIAAASLPSLAGCADAVALRERLPLPEDEGVRTEIEDLRQRIAHAAALEHTGQTDDALETIEAVAERATELDWAPLSAEAHHRLGSTLETIGRYADAEAALRVSAVAAEIARDDTLLADVRTLLVLVVGDRGGRPREGHLWAELAEAAIERHGSDPQLLAKLESNLAFVLDREVGPEQVLPHHERALALLIESEAEPLRLAEAHGNLAGTLAEVGRRDEALEHARTALAAWTDYLGPDHVYTATAVATLAYVHDSAGEIEQALEHYERATVITERALGADSPVTAQRLGNLAIARARSGNLDSAIADFARVVELQRRAHGPEHAEVATAEFNLAAAYGMADRREEALQHHEAALRLRTKLFGEDHLQVAGSLDGVANQLENLERPKDAIPYRERGLAIRERVHGPEHAELVLPLTNLAHNLLVIGKLGRAEPMAERALKLAGAPSLRADERAYPRAVLGSILATKGEAARAQTLLDQATADLGDAPSVATRRVLEDARAKLSAATR